MNSNVFPCTHKHCISVVCDTISTGGHLKSNVSRSETHRGTRCPALITLWRAQCLAVPCRANKMPYKQLASFLPGHHRLHKPNASQSTLTHSSDRCQIKYNTHTHRYGHFHQKYSILFDNDDWCWSKKTLQQKQTPVVSINQLFGRGGTESPHWSSHRPNVSISESFILGPISYTTSAALAKTEGRTGYKTMDVISC